MDETVGMKLHNGKKGKVPDTISVKNIEFIRYIVSSR